MIIKIKQLLKIGCDVSCLSINFMFFPSFFRPGGTFFARDIFESYLYTMSIVGSFARVTESYARVMRGSTRPDFSNKILL